MIAKDKKLKKEILKILDLPNFYFFETDRKNNKNIYFVSKKDNSTTLEELKLALDTKFIPFFTEYLMKNFTHSSTYIQVKNSSQVFTNLGLTNNLEDFVSFYLFNSNYKNSQSSFYRFSIYPNSIEDRPCITTVYIEEIFNIQFRGDYVVFDSILFHVYFDLLSVL